VRTLREYEPIILTTLVSRNRYDHKQSLNVRLLQALTCLYTT